MGETTKRAGGRPPTEVGEWGKITTSKEGGHHVARARVRDLRGRLKSVQRKGDTADEARGRLKEALRGEAKRVYDTEITPDTTFKALAESYVKGLRRGDFAQTTRDRYEHAIVSVLVPEIGDLPLRKLTTRRLQVLFDALADAGRMPAGLAAIRTPLAGAMHLALLEGVYTANPAKNVTLARKRSPYSSGELTDVELSELLASVEKDAVIGERELYDILVLLLGTGCRISEAVGLRWWDITLSDDWRGCVISFRHNGVAIKGKGMQFQEGKTQAAKREVLMTPMVREVMHRRARYPGNTPDQPVFPVGGHNRPRYPQDIREFLRVHYAPFPVLRDTKQPTHIFRKTAATMMLEQGVPPEVVADQLGHASMQMVMEVYRLRRQRSERAMHALDFTAGTRGQLGR